MFVVFLFVPSLSLSSSLSLSYPVFFSSSDSVRSLRLSATKNEYITRASVVGLGLGL